MAIFERGDVVRVPFPYTDRATRQHRPALVVSKGLLGSGGHLLWVLMITSEENRACPDDVALGEGYRSAGLPAPSMIRCSKIATIECEQANVLGRVSPDVLAKVQKHLRAQLAL